MEELKERINRIERMLLLMSERKGFFDVSGGSREEFNEQDEIMSEIDILVENIRIEQEQQN